MKEKICKTSILFLKLLARGLMALVIIFGFFWMAQNITVIPSFGDSQEYLNLSQTLALDEYRTILYPLILRWVRKISDSNYHILLYFIQTGISFLSIFYGVHTIKKIICKSEKYSKRIGLEVFLSLYLMTIPMITFMNFSVLTDSLATSILVLFLSVCIQMFSEEEPSIKVYILMGISLIIESLLRADRLYSCLFLTVCVFLICLLKKRQNRKQLMIAMLTVCLSVTLTTKTVNYFTQTVGLNGRIQTNMEFVLLDRIVWPNMAANYSYFPQEIKDIISFEDAKTFDSHNNNVMYQMAPLIEEKVGKEKAKKMYLEMARIVFSNQTKKVLCDIGEDILSMLATPFSSMLNAHRMGIKKGDSWNIHCMSTNNPALTKNYNYFYQYSFLALLFIGIIVFVLKKVLHQNTNVSHAVSIISPYVGMSIILTLWFSLGDGAPPNDRYAMIIYITWSLFNMMLMGL